MKRRSAVTLLDEPFSAGVGAFFEALREEPTCTKSCSSVTFTAGAGADVEGIDAGTVTLVVT